MENQKLNRVFDQVKLSPEREEAMLADLLSEKKGVSGMKQTNRRRIPAAVLAAAVLVVLAGTALAVEYFGKVEIELVDNMMGHKSGGYMAYGPNDRIPVEELSEEVRTLCAGMKLGDRATLPFRDWTAAEEYLGIELADNEVLERYVKSKGIQYDSTSPSGHPEKRYTHCRVDISASDDHLPQRIRVETWSQKEDFTISVAAQMLTDAATEWDKTGQGTYFRGETSFREYTTPNGLEATIYSEATEIGNFNKLAFKECTAYFVKNGVFFSVQVFDAGSVDQGAGNPWDTLIEILDAYE